VRRDSRDVEHLNWPEAGEQAAVLVEVAGLQALCTTWIPAGEGMKKHPRYIARLELAHSILRLAKKGMTVPQIIDMTHLHRWEVRRLLRMADPKFKPVRERPYRERLYRLTPRPDNWPSLVQAYESGACSLADLGRETGHASLVRKWLEQDGVVLRHTARKSRPEPPEGWWELRKAYEEGRINITGIVEIVGVSFKEARRWLVESGSQVRHRTCMRNRPLPEGWEELVQRFRRRQVNMADIGRAVGLTRERVRQVLMQSGEDTSRR